MLDGLDLFSGIGGISIALEDWVRPIAYCESDRYAQAVLLSHMGDGSLPKAPIWDDVRTLMGTMLPSIDIIYGGFPCQDISVAGNGKGLGGERSGLFHEIIRLTSELSPGFVFLENVPAIRTRGLDQVLQAFTDIRYDCRWTCVSAAEVGAPHLRKRWFLLAHSKRSRGGCDSFQKQTGGNEAELLGDTLAHSNGELLRQQPRRRSGKNWQDKTESRNHGTSESMAESNCKRLERPAAQTHQGREYQHEFGGQVGDGFGASGGWPTEPSICRVADGVPHRVDRIKCLGNSVVPIQAKEAFERLMGFYAQ